MVEIFLLEQLVAFARTGTLSQAALELHITQPALSRSMKKLEEELGVPLFDRSKSKISLNETGKVAAKYGERVLEADREMIRQTLAFERSRRTFVFGSCAALPVNGLLPVFQEHFRGMAITSEIADDEKLISGLKNHIYQMAVLHSWPEDSTLFSQKYMEESLYVTFPGDHPLALAKTISARELEGLHILAHGGAGFWLDICRQNLKNTRLLIQDSMEVLGELVEASSLPVFSSDRAAERGYNSRGRTAVPISEKWAHTSYYLCCLSGEKARYKKVFKAAGCREER